jgi:CheY-like chemotaxis protein
MAILMNTHPTVESVQAVPSLPAADQAAAWKVAWELARLTASSDPAALNQLDLHADQLRALWQNAFAGIESAIRQFDWEAAETMLTQQGCASQGQGTASQTHPLTVLTVDDNPVNITLMTDLLAPHYSVRAARSGKRALQIAQTQHIDLVLLDVMMPVIDGYEVCKRLQALPSMAACPVLFLTAKNQIEDTEYGLQLGAQDYISKPISPPLVLKRIQTHLALSALKKEGVGSSRDCAPIASPCKASDQPD